MAVMRLKRSYNAKSLTLADIQAMRETFITWFGDNDASTYRLIYRTEVATFETITEVQNHIAKNGLPEAFFHRRANSAGREAIFDTTNPAVISIDANSIEKSP